MSLRFTNQSGFTLLELLVTVTVLGILMAIAVPSLQGAAEKRRTIAAAERIYSQLQFARSEAISRSQAVYFNIDTNAGWAIGVSDNAACDPADNAPPCTLPDMNNANPITHLITSNDHNTINLATTNNQIEFLPQRGTATATTINLTSTGSKGYVMTVNVMPLGQISLCSSNADPVKYVTSYRAC